MIKFSLARFSVFVSQLFFYPPVSIWLTVEQEGGPMPRLKGPTWPHRHTHTHSHKHRWGIGVRTEAKLVSRNAKNGGEKEKS